MASGGEVVIIGGGIMGCATAYYLTSKGHKHVTVLERVAVANGASGKAGGFLAKSWCRGAMDSMARRSFAMHQELARTLHLQSFRHLDVLSVASEPAPPTASEETRPLLPAWMDRHRAVFEVGVLSSSDEAAQVHPKELTSALMAAAQKQGAKLAIGRAIDIRFRLKPDGTKQVCGVKAALKDAHGKEVSLVEIPADAVVLAMGPWTSQAASWGGGLLVPRVEGQKAHSITMQPSPHAHVTPHAIFTEFPDGENPEIYPRPDGEVYACGMSEDPTFPIPPPEKVTCTPGACAQIKRRIEQLSSVIESARVTAEQACYLPCGATGVPAIGPVPRAQGVFVCAGHACWGILTGPASGDVMSSQVLQYLRPGGDAPGVEVDVSAFDPQRLLVES